MRTLAPGGASTRAGGGRRELNTIVRISFSLEGEVHVRTQDRVARHRGGHRSAGSQRVHADRDRHAISVARRKYESCVEGAEDGAPGGDKSAWKDSYVAIKDVVATDPKTVTITLKQPYAPLLSVLAMFSGGILPADMAKATDTKDYDNTLAWKTKGTGAYYSEGWKKGDQIILKRNPNYWKGTPALDEVRIEYIPDDNTRVLKLQGGETDVVDFVPFSQIATLNTQPGIKAQTFSIQQTAFIILNTSKPPLNDV